MIINTIQINDFNKFILNSNYFSELSMDGVKHPILYEKEDLDSKYYYFGDELELLKIIKTLKLI